MDRLLSEKAVLDAILGEPTDAHYPSWYADKVRKLPTAESQIIACGEGELVQNLAEVGTDLISRAEAQTELQLSARRYTVAHEAHGEGRVVWSEDLISVSDAMDVLRKISPASLRGRVNFGGR